MNCRSSRHRYFGREFWFVFAMQILFVGALVAAGPAPIKVIVSIPPQAYFVERIGVGSVDIVTLITPGQSPAVFDPTPKLMTELQRADLYFTAGVPFENGLLSKIAAQWPELSIVDLSLSLEPPPSHSASSDSHQGHAHDHDGDAPHVWLDPTNVKRMANVICERLIETDPTQASTFKNNLLSFTQDLDNIDTEIKRRLASVKRHTFYVYHPAFGQFADAYGLTQVPIEVDGKEPSARQLAVFIERAKRDSVRAVFVQPQFSGKSAGAIARAVGARLVEMDPLAHDYLRNLESMTAKLVDALGDDR